MSASLERLFFLIAAYCRIPTHPGAFINFFAETSRWVYQEARRRGIWNYLQVRLSQRAFALFAEERVGSLYASRRVEFVLRLAVADKLVGMSSVELPNYFHRVEEDFLRGYLETLPPELRCEFVSEQFLHHRTVWLRETAIRLLPALFVVAALGFASASLFTMSSALWDSARTPLMMLREFFSLK